MSWDAIKGIKQGERDAKAAERAKKRGKFLGGGCRGKGRKRVGFLRSAGRAAVSKMKIRGRGISIQVQENSSNFSARIKYVLNPEKGPELIFRNGDIRSMMFASMMRPDIKEPCGHITMSLPPRVGKITKEEWAVLAKTAREALGLDDTFPIIVVAHNDRPHLHLHWIFSRVAVTGKVHDQRNLGLKCASVERIVENKHSLQLVLPSEFKTHGHITKNEIEKGLRTRQKPERLQIADALKIAVQGRPDVRQFIERLNAAGVGVKANISPSTNKMNGFSFTFGGVAFSGSKIAREYGWQQLERAINCDQNRDHIFLTQLDGTTGTASENLAGAVAAVGAINSAVAAVPTQAPDAGANQSNDPAITHRASELARKAKPVEAQPAVRGFSRDEILDSSHRGWISSVHNRIICARLLADKKQRADRVALLNERNKIAAISIALGYAVPEPREISDAQINALFADLGGEQIEIRGTPDFCARAEAVGLANGVKVVHEFQVSAAEKKAAEARLAARAREELSQKSRNLSLPVFTPK